MIKDYDSWNIIKKQVELIDVSSTYFYEREIWWCCLGTNIGQEECGKGESFLRPVLIFKKFSSNLCWIIPLSTKVKTGSHFFPLLAISNTIRTAVLIQMKSIDSKRFKNRIDSISPEEYELIKEKITDLTR